MLSKASIDHLFKHLNPSSRIVMRADFNVPIKDGKITDPNRIVATLPTIQELLKHNPKSLVLLSHLGRPNGQKNMKYTLRPVLDQLSTYLNRKVTFLDECASESTINQVNKSNQEVFLCENVRFHEEEEGSHKDADGKKIKADPEKVKLFRSQLSQLGDCYVNDAFGTAHRAHSSVVGINHKFRVAGLLMKKELNFLGNFLEKPKKPIIVILGGAKVSDKINLIKNMIKFGDEIILGGGLKTPFMTEIFHRKVGMTMNIKPEDPKILQDIMDLAKAENCKIHFPIDHRIAKEMKAGTAVSVIKDGEDVPDDMEIFDMGPESAKYFDSIISRAGSIFWNGPLGVIELKEFRNGSLDVLRSIIKATKNGATSIIGGGDSASLVNKEGLSDQVTWVSTGGGATIELLEGKQLPGVKNLS